MFWKIVTNIFFSDLLALWYLYNWIACKNWWETLELLVLIQRLISSWTFLNLRKKILIFKAQNSVCLECVSLSLYEQSEITLFFIITLTNYKRSKKVTLGDGHIFLRFNLSFELCTNRILKNHKKLKSSYSYRTVFNFDPHISVIFYN